MGPCVDAGTWLFTSGASITNDALALSGVEWGTALASGWLGGMVVDSLGVAGWIGAVAVVLALGATVLFDAVAALWAWGPVFLVGVVSLVSAVAGLMCVSAAARVGASVIECVGACADSPVPGVCWFGIVFNVGDPLAAPLPLPFPLPPPVPLPLPV